jgi:hypothetical protein
MICNTIFIPCRVASSFLPSCDDCRHDRGHAFRHHALHAPLPCHENDHVHAHGAPHDGDDGDYGLQAGFRKSLANVTFFYQYLQYE